MLMLGPSEIPLERRRSSDDEGELETGQVCPQLNAKDPDVLRCNLIGRLAQGFLSHKKIKIWGRNIPTDNIRTVEPQCSLPNICSVAVRIANGELMSAC